MARSPHLEGENTDNFKKNKVIAILTIFVTIFMPIAGFFSIPMPATKNDIVQLQQADIKIYEDIDRKSGSLLERNLQTEMRFLNLDEEKYTERKYENIRQQDEFKLSGKPVPAAYTQEQSDIESKLKHIEHDIDLKKQELMSLESKLDK